MSSIKGTLLEEYEETVCFMDRKTVALPDGYGGISQVTNEYVEGAEFIAAITPDTSTTAQIAQAETEVTRYRITTDSGITLTAGDYIKRKVNGETYKVLHSNADKKAPDSSTLSAIRSTTMERVKLV